MTMNLLLDPNIAYVFLMGGFWLVVMSILTPGTGFLELGALLALGLAGWGIYSLPVNWWAIVILLVGVAPFLLAVRKSGRLGYLAISILALVIGSAYLFPGEGWRPGVHPILATLVSAATAGFMWWTTVKSLEAQRMALAHNIDAVIGQEGLTRTPVFREGSVWVKMEEWSARSKTLIPENTPVRVVAREGFMLVIEALEELPLVENE